VIFYIEQNDPTQRSRSEDSIIAWTWRTYLDDPTPDKEIILRMPMTKVSNKDIQHFVTRKLQFNSQLKSNYSVAYSVFCMPIL